jgi:hypothetical protein
VTRKSGNLNFEIRDVFGGPIPAKIGIGKIPDTVLVFSAKSGRRRGGTGMGGSGVWHLSSLWQASRSDLGSDSPGASWLHWQPWTQPSQSTHALRPFGTTLLHTGITRISSSVLQLSVSG